MTAAWAGLAAVVVAADAPRVVTEPLVLRNGGTPDNPAVFDGRGMVIDLGIDVTAHDWIQAGDVWTSSGPLLGRKPLTAGQLAGLFVEEVPVSIPRDVAAETARPDRKGFCYLSPDKLGPGQMGYRDDGTVYFRWPAGKPPGSARVLLPPAPNTSCVTIACSHIVVRNVTAKHAANDGFNVHGKWVGVRLENVRALSNADEGISAHDDVDMEVVGAEVAWNGSAAGGVADVNRCTTRYRDCRVHDNLGAAFYFSGREHAVRDCVIFRQARDFVVRDGTTVVRDRVEWRRGD